MGDATVDLWALDEVHFQQQGSRCRMWIPPELKDPVVYHHPTRKSVGYFAAVRLRDGKFLFRRETGRLNGETFFPAAAFWPSAITHSIIARNFIWSGETNRPRSSDWTSCRPIALI